jgi:hypothetical protein
VHGSFGTRAVRLIWLREQGTDTGHDLALVSTT